jgi:hypothetical protein
MGINPDVASTSSAINSTSSPSTTFLQGLILNTPTRFLRVRQELSCGSRVAQVNRVNHTIY